MRTIFAGSKNMSSTITLYGTDWCGDCRYTSRHLTEAGIAFTYVNIDEDSEGEKNVLKWNKGRRRVPTLVLDSDAGQTTLSVPRNEELDRELKKHGFL